MQEINISFQGINLSTPSDICSDGQLETCIGLEMHNGSLRPSVLQGTQYTLPEEYAGCLLKVLHTTSQYSHFIFLSSDKRTVYWSEVAEGTLELKEALSMESDITDIKCVGNTLVLLASDGMHYSLFKDDPDKHYKYLGQKPPETVIHFSLVSELYRHEEVDYRIKHKDIVSDYYTDVAYTDTGYMELNEGLVEDFTSKENVMASALLSRATDQGRIMFPVLTRYAYRMYDGSSYIMQSSPVLLVPNTGMAPAVVYRAGSDIISSSVTALANASLIIYNIHADVLDDWKDIISSIDIFMTDQMYSRNLDAKVTHTIRLSESDAGKSLNYGIFPSGTNRLGPKSLHDTWKDMGGSENETEGYMYMFYGEAMRNVDFLKKPAEASVFYKAHSISLTDMEVGTDKYLFDPEDETSVTLRTLTLQETLPDDYQSHDLLKPASIFVYNRRLNISNIKRDLFGGYDTSAMIAYVQTAESVDKYYTVYTHIKKGSYDIVVRNTCSGLRGFYPMYLYYPDPDAYMMTIVESNNPDPAEFYDGWRIELNKHPFLNGSVWFSGFKTPEQAFRNVFPPETTSSQVSYENMLATSEVRNPFFFPLSLRNTIGTGSILGLSSIVTPLSQGQFGAFDLMIFTSEGNYAASVTSEGSYSTIKPMPRDVCVNPGSIVPADYTVLYVSAKGLMSANGSNIEYLSDALEGVFSNESYPQPSVFLQSCQIAYDYTGQRIILASSESPYAFVRGRDGLWFMSEWGKVDSVLNVYPYAYIQRGTSLVCLDKPYNYTLATTNRGELLTRPLKLGSLQLKSIHQMVVEGNLGETELSLYASQDAVTWTKIGSISSPRIRRMAGRSFKYWKIGIEASLDGSQSISGIRLQVQYRKESRFR